MVPPEGETSNPETSGYEEEKDAQTEDVCGFDELSTTLAEWNDYLENHVPYFQRSRDDPAP